MKEELFYLLMFFRYKHLGVFKYCNLSKLAMLHHVLIVGITTFTDAFAQGGHENVILWTV